MAKALDNKRILQIYELMLKSRRFDERVQALVDAGVYLPHFHSGWGQEALMVAGTLPFKDTDYFLYTHRGYGHLIARDIPVKLLMTDMFCKVGGTNDGMGNIMHVVYPQKGILGRNGVFGARFGIAASPAQCSNTRKY